MTLMASEIVLKPVISEKSMDETQRGKYTFRVHSDANKLQVKEAIEELFKVEVLERQRLHDQVQGEVAQPPPHPHQGLDVALEEGRRHPRPSGQKIEFFEGV